MFDIGDTVPLAVEVYDADGDLTNAGSITLTITLPDGTTTSPSITNPPAETGIYTHSYVPAMAGRYHVRWTATTPSAGFTDTFDVRAGSVGIISLKQGRDHLKIPAADTSLDEELRLLIEGVSGVVESYVGIVARRSFTETRSGGRPGIALRNTPVLSITSVTENGTAVDASGYTYADGILTRLAGSYTAGCWLAGVNNIVIVTVAGRSQVGAHLLLAVQQLLRINAKPLLAGVFSSTDPGPGEGEGEWRNTFWVPRGVLALLTVEPGPIGIG